jgi:3-octaprenyl-4-hydroxybenzoate carboxy-lyase
MIAPSRQAIDGWAASLAPHSAANLQEAAKRIAEAKSRGGKVVVVTGSGPNLHEGVTTLIAELMYKGVIDGAITSSAVIAHEMGGTLDRVKRVPAQEHPELAIPVSALPRGGLFEITLLTNEQRAAIAPEVGPWWVHYDRMSALSGSVIIKAAANMAWPMGPRTELLAREAEALARESGSLLESVVGLGADPMTMIGAGAALNIPVVVSIPQLVGGGTVGLAIGDAVSITRRARTVAETLASADVIIESAIALSQEIHDGPFETYTGHGIWSDWKGDYSYSLKNKMLVRIDLDPNLEAAWRKERQSADVQRAVDQGLPKTKLTGIPFRMEMSGFARLENSIPVTADIGVAWPVLAADIAARLGLKLDFISAPQESAEGKRMREWIADSIQFVDRGRMFEKARQLARTAAQ